MSFFFFYLLAEEPRMNGQKDKRKKIRRRLHGFTYRNYESFRTKGRRKKGGWKMEERQTKVGERGKGDESEKGTGEEGR